MNRLIIFLIAAVMISSISAKTQIVAHRGFHQNNGAARNSIEALERAQK